ncbi:MAG: VOC family protein [Actinobacteria bacterium]|nr:MAG: VOC family protein [Actinomycetota bacterium]
MSTPGDMAPVRHEDLYHTGIVVEDLDAAIAEFTDLFGLRWGPHLEFELPVLSADGVQQVPFHAIYNSDGPHHLELVQAVKGTLWTVPGAGHAHHMGYWAKDVGAASRYLESKGLPRVAAIGARSESDTGRAVYHQGRAGVYIELVDPAGAEYIFGPA